MTFNPLDTALAYLECVRRLDTAAMQTYFAADARVWLPGQGWMAPAGLAALLDGAARLVSDGMQFTHEDALVDGNRVVVMTACDSPLVKGGSYVNQFCFVFSFDANGKIAEMREYTDSGPAVAAFHS
jgi:ketosteroid isomerase-like protein